MRFKTIAIENVFSYYGLKHFDFESSDKPISLIIGENGFGKTSFINSVKIALHGVGKDILNIGSQTLTKQDFIIGNSEKNFSGVLNRQARLEGIETAKITITLEDEDVLIVERSYTIKNGHYSEALHIYDEDHNFLAQGDDAQDIINSKISMTMARFFFFDGEKIQTIADFSHEEFTQMLEDVLELDIYDQMAQDAEYLIRKINKAELDQDLQQQVEDQENRIADIAVSIETMKFNLQSENMHLKELESDKRELDNKLKKLRSRYQKPLAEAREKLLELQAAHTELIEQMKQITLVQLPLLLNSKLKERVIDDLEQNYRSKVQINQEVLSVKKEQLLSLLAQQNSDGSIANAFDTVFQSSSENQSVSFADPYKLELQFDSLPSIDLKSLLTSLSDNAQEIKECETEIITLEHKIADDKKEYEADFKLANEMIESITRQKVKCEDIETIVSNLLIDEKALRSELSKLTIAEHKNDLANSKIKTLKSVVDVSAVMKQKIKKEKRAHLEDSINLKFKLLKKEGYEADEIVLDEDFNINLYDINGNAMDILSSSSGQKQIIATALIWGISEYIAEDIPMIIDTPLGRLDERNQSLILNEFYPNVSKQVIILPTPSELKHEGFKSLAGHVSQTFMLNNAGSATSISTVDVNKIILHQPQQLALEFA